MTEPDGAANDHEQPDRLRLARLLGWTDGQLLSMAIGLIVAVLLLYFGLTATLGENQTSSIGSGGTSALTSSSPPTLLDPSRVHLG